jgi:DNA-binding response OmpR family regulator
MSNIKNDKGIILVVDNNPGNLRLLENILTENGYKVRPAISGKLALMTIQSTLPDLILLDVRMPEIDGYSVCKTIKANDVTRHIPVIFISALDEPINKIKAFEVGGVDYITKPFETEEVLIRVKTQIDIKNMQKELANQNKQLQSEIAERKLTEQQLQKIRQELEIRVKERTMDLETVNKNLQAEIQHRKDAQLQLQQAQKLEAIGTLASGISHDFNNILTIIHTCSHLIMAEISSEHNAYENIGKIIKASERASELVNQILTFSKYQTANFSKISIVPIVRDAIHLLESTMPSQIKLNIKIDIGNELISGDTIQIYQVIMNLCTNAVHAMEKQESGELSILLTSQMITDDDQYRPLQAGNHIRLTVKDTGEGIDPSLMARIFDPYFTTKGKGRGTGLGLAVTLGIVEKHKGIIQVNSNIHQGTSFDIFFPIIDAMKQNHSNEQKYNFMGNEHILLVDDEIDLLQPVQLLLEHIGFKVSAFNKPIEAYDAFEKNPEKFDLLIVDLAMPEMNGKQLTRKIKTIRNDLPVMMSSGNKSELSDDEMKELGLSGFLMKPFLKKELSESIRQVLSESRQ